MPQIEKVIETKTCKMCSAKFEITDKDLEFYDKISPTLNGKKYLIPTPTFCPDCRRQRRQSFINDTKIYKSKSSLSGESIISMYSPDKKMNIYSQKEWWEGNFKPYEKEFDFSKTFNEQFYELLQKTPLPVLNAGYFNMVNSDYNNACGDLKNCYLTFESDYNEDCLYAYGIANCKKSMDLYRCFNMENSYSCVDCKNSYKLFFSENCNNCSESYYLKNCSGCINCYGCNNINDKKYCIFNKEYTKEEYFEKLKSIKFGDLDKNLKIINKNINSLQCENIYGDYIYNSKNCYYCFDVNNCKDCKYIDGVQLESKGLYDISQFGGDTEKCYEGVVIGKRVFNSAFSSYLYFGCENILYSTFCVDNVKNLFGCVGLRNKEYCILNKQYSKEEYESLVPKIIEHMQKTGEWGEFFPSSISPFGYNETAANEHFPLDKNEALNNGFNWSDYESPFPKVEKIIKASMLPNDISKIPDDILNWAIECEESGKPFRIMPAELDFYRNHKLNIPKKHPEVRHLDRLSLRNPRKLFDSNCHKCGIDIKTTYSPDRKEIVYCENCYNKEIF